MPKQIKPGGHTGPRTMQTQDVDRPAEPEDLRWQAAPGERADSSARPTDLDGLPSRPRLRADVVFEEPRARVQIRMGLHELAVLVPADRAVAGWLDTIDGSRGLAEVVSTAPALVGGRSSARSLLKRLDRLGAFDDVALPIPAGVSQSRAARLLPARRELAAGRGTDAAGVVLAARARSTVAVYGAGRLGILCGEAIADLGVGKVRHSSQQMTSKSPGADLHILFAGLGMSGGVNLCNDAALARRAAHVTVEVGAETATVCPVRTVGASGCAGCLNLWRADRGLVSADLLHTWRGRSPAPLSAITEPLLLSIVLSTTIATLDGLLLDEAGSAESATIECDLLDRASTTTVLPVHPRCRCGYAGPVAA